MTVVRNKLYELGLFKLELEYWTPEQVAFLKANYKRIGDLELSEIFSKKWFKKKGWNKKHIEKKRRYLKLKRSERQKFNILLRNVAQGRFEGMNWANSLDRRRHRVGTVIVRTIAGYKVKLVRVKGGFRKLSHINFEESFGPIPSGRVIVMKDGNPLNCEPDNLFAADRKQQAELMRYSDGGIANYLALKGRLGGGNCKDVGLYEQLLKRPDILDAKRKQLQLQKLIGAL